MAARPELAQGHVLLPPHDEVKVFVGCLAATLAVSVFGCASRALGQDDRVVTVALVEESSDAVTADGVFEEPLWTGARRIPLGEDASVGLIAGPDALLVAVSASGATPRYVDLYFDARNGTILNLHASMQTGQRRLVGDDWTDERPEWRWGEGLLWRANSAEMREDASPDAPLGEQIRSMQGYEFVIRHELIGKGPWRVFLEYRDFVGEAVDVRLPADGSRHDVDGWLVLTPERPLPEEP